MTDDEGSRVDLGEIDGIARLRPELAAAIDAYHAFAATKVDPAIVMLCRLRMAQIQDGVEGPVEATAETAAAGLSEAQLRDLAAWRDSREFSDPQRACLEMAEFFCYTAQSVTDEHVEAIARHLSPEQIVTLTAGYWVADASGRLANFFSSLEVANDDNS